ncbi:MAG: hypothetical protein P0Y60_16075 [Candidatus Microbacterium colombiense]|nr:MAG: hypothetical protein P0Y60_16075 [Microbacterium sp.]
MNSGQIASTSSGLDEAVARAVLRVHREHDEVADAVDAVLLRLERDERVEEVRDAEALAAQRRKSPTSAAR